MTDLVLSLVTFALVATTSPGGATTLATASGAQFGLVRSIPLLAGIALGLASLVGVVAGGVGSLLASWPQSQLWLRLAGSAYLLWLAWTIARLGSPQSRSAGGARPMAFPTGLLMLWMNPKAWTMAAAAAAAYASLSQSPFGLALLLGAVFGIAAAVSLTLWCTCGAWLARPQNRQRMAGGKYHTRPGTCRVNHSNVAITGRDCRRHVLPELVGSRVSCHRRSSAASSPIT
jgi:threonine/homoserine/homoserine lactone efflux protein